jgi:hypothetical protein
VGSRNYHVILFYPGLCGRISVLLDTDLGNKTIDSILRIVMQVSDS